MVSFVAIAQCADIVGQRIDPDVNHVVGVKCDRNAPLERGAGNAQVFQTGLDEVVYQLYRTGFRLKIVGLCEQLFNAVGEGGHLHEVCLFLCLGHLTVTFRTAAVFVQLGFRPEALARGAVLALVLALVDVAQIVQLLENLLYRLYVVIVGGADVAVIADVHLCPEGFERLDDLVHVFFRGNALGSGFLFDFQTVLIGTGEKDHIIALHPSVACDGIAGNGGVAVSDVRIAGRIVDRCGNIERLF